MTRGLSPELKDKMLANIPLKQLGKAEDVAAPWFSWQAKGQRTLPGMYNPNKDALIGGFKMSAQD